MFTLESVNHLTAYSTRVMVIQRAIKRIIWNVLRTIKKELAELQVFKWRIISARNSVNGLFPISLDYFMQRPVPSRRFWQAMLAFTDAFHEDNPASVALHHADRLILMLTQCKLSPARIELDVMLRNL
jgi:hypothetical protein